MTLETRRRNGKEASCEPCRRAKVRCDHEQPVCGRCRKRSLQSKCFYHPAPLTKSRESDVEVAIDAHHRDTDKRPDYLTPADSIGTSHALEPTPDVPAFGKLGRLSRTRLLIGENGHRKRVLMVTEALTHLRHFTMIDKIIRKYFSVTQASTMPNGLLLPALDALAAWIDLHELHDVSACSSAKMEEVAEAILQSTSTPVNITPSLRPDEFVTLYTTPHFRLEYLGLIYAIGWRIDLLDSIWSEQARDEFMESTFRCTSICLQLARELTPVNDVMLWLSLETMLHCTNIHGDMGEPVWHLLGDLSSDIYNLGVHQEASITAGAPFFLAECRRRTFAKSYHIDGLLASLFNRPPRILRRFADCKLPLNLSEEDLLAEPVQLEQACGKLAPDGWNPDGIYFPTTSIRLRYLTGEIREEAAAYEGRPLTSENIAELQQLLLRNRQIWRSLPPDLTYTSQGWTANQLEYIPTAMAMMNSLTFLQNDFHIQRLMEKGDPRATASLVESASTILGIVSDMALLRWQRGKLRFNDSSLVAMIFGVPSAAVLATAVQRIARHGVHASALPPGMSPSSLIRTLSVFVYELQNVCGTNEANYDVCIQASKTVANTLNAVLDELCSSVSAPRLQAPGLNDDGTGFDAVGALLPDAFEGFDLSSWAQCIDWTGIGADWSYF